MNLHHELFLMQAGLDRMPIKPPMSVATINMINTTPAKLTLDDFILAARAAKNTIPPKHDLELTKAEFEQLDDQLEKVLSMKPRGLYVGATDEPEFMGLRIIIKP